MFKLKIITADFQIYSATFRSYASMVDAWQMIRDYDDSSTIVQMSLRQG